MSPAVFIPAAEESGLIIELGELMLRRALSDLAALERARPDLAGLRITVNVSPRQLQQPGFTAMVADGWSVYALTPATDAVSLDRISATHDRIALLVGSERGGLTAASMAAATARVSIPMHVGVDSLNVASATAVACWQFRRV